MIAIVDDNQNPSFASARRGFAALGFRDFKTIPVRTRSLDLDDIDCVVAYGNMTQAILASVGVECPDIDYPACLRPYLHRELVELKGGMVTRLHYPRFIKPYKTKKFKGRVINNCAEVQIGEDDWLWASDLVQFQAEWRVFVIDSEIVDVRPYKGDWHYHYNPAVIEQMVDTYHPYAGFAIDVGVLSSGETALVEVNDGYALGDYGLRSDLYADLLIRRWNQLTESVSSL